MEPVAGGGSSKMTTPQGKGSRNKRKFAEPTIVDPNKAVSSEESGSKDHSDGLKLELELASPAPSSSEIKPSQTKEEHVEDEFHDAKWNSLTENQLEEIVLSNLDAIFKSAISKVVESGYTEDVATKSILRIGIWYGCNDTVSNIVYNALAFLRNDRKDDDSQELLRFDDLVQLEKFVLYELVCVVREIRPSLSFGDAMWCLLICDMNAAQACAMDSDTLSSSSVLTEPKSKSGTKDPELSHPSPSKLISFGSQPAKSFVGGKSGLDNLKNSQILSGLSERGCLNCGCGCISKFSSIAATSQSSLGVEKSGGIVKVHSSSTKRDSIIQHKSFHVEKGYRTYGSKGSSRGGKMTSLSSLILDKKLKYVSETTTLKTAALNISKALKVELIKESSDRSSVPAANVSEATDTSSMDRGPNAIVTFGTSTPVPASDLSFSLSSKGKVSTTFISSKNEVTKTGSVAIPLEKSFGQWIPQDHKDELILKLVMKIRGLQNQLQSWTDWTNEKVMQVTCRLSKDKAELRALRQEKEEVERLKKEKQSLEDNAMKKLSEIENAVSKSSDQVKQANAAVRRLEVENAVLQKEMEAAKLRAAQSARNFQEALRREKDAEMKFQSQENQQSLLKEELMTEKQKLAQLNQEVEQAKGKKEQSEARLQQVVKAKEELLQQASSIRKERERIEEAAKAKEDMIKMRAEENAQRYREAIQKLEKELAMLRHETDSSKIAALRRGIEGSYSGSSMEMKTGAAPEDSSSRVSELVTNLKDMSLTKGVKRERECVMCLSEEMSVVFLPCAHQVVCTACNDLHEKQGMQECPSCRTLIQQRITARFART